MTAGGTPNVGLGAYDPYGGLVMGGLVTMFVIGVPVAIIAIVVVNQARKGNSAAVWLVLVVAALVVAGSAYGALYDGLLNPYGSWYNCPADLPDWRRCAEFPWAYLTVAVVSAVVAARAVRSLRRMGKH